jgi:hypothetical protein
MTRSLTDDIGKLCAHLTLSGYKPVMFQTGRGRHLGITNGRQTFWVMYGGDVYESQFAYKHDEVGWQRLNHITLRKLAAHVTPEMQGFTGDSDGT